MPAQGIGRLNRCLPTNTPQVWPICGDGMDFTVRLKPNGPRRAQTLLKRAYDADPNAQPNRQKIEWKMHIRTGARARAGLHRTPTSEGCQAVPMHACMRNSLPLCVVFDTFGCGGAGDVIDFTVEPRGNHDCDGLYIVDIQIWKDDFATTIDW